MDAGPEHGYLWEHDGSPSRSRSAFGKAVRKRRLALGLSQERLADLSDLHRTYLSDIERGARNPSLASIVRIARALRTTPSSLLEKVR
ncbi:MAG: helix-turn-helix transcriptional regulator [Planctomycetes bacterium]|nr:helix-turn-helix transcriptional regulator [Planctomycetota bacterium]